MATIPIIAGTTLSDLSRNSLANQQIEDARRQAEDDRLYRTMAFNRLSAAQQQQGELEHQRLGSLERVGLAPYQSNPVEMARIQAQERMNDAVIKGQTEIAKFPFSMVNPTELARIAGGVKIAGLDAESRALIAKAQLYGTLDAHEMERFRAILAQQSTDRMTQAHRDIGLGGVGAQLYNTDALREQNLFNYRSGLRNIAPYWESSAKDNQTAAISLLPSLMGGSYGPQAMQRGQENLLRQQDAAAATKKMNTLFEQYKKYGRGGEGTWSNRIPSLARQIPYLGPFAGAITGAFLGGKPMSPEDARKAAQEDTLKGYDQSRITYDPNSLGFLPVPVQDNSAHMSAAATMIMQNAFPNVDWAKVFSAYGGNTPGQQPGQPGQLPQPAPTGGGTNAVPWNLNPRGGLE